MAAPRRGHPVAVAVSRPDDELAPAGLRLRPDPGTRLVAGGSVLVGGSPVRVLRLTRAGARQVAAWFAGTPVPSGASARRLARRLLDAGIAHPDFAVRGEAGGSRGTDAARSAGEAWFAGEAVPAGEAS